MVKSKISKLFTLGVLAIFCLLVILPSGASNSKENVTRQISPSKISPSKVMRVTTTLQGSLDLGDLGPRWTNSINILGGERLIFRWTTQESKAKKGRWEVLDSTDKVVKAGNLTTAPTPGNYKGFFIDFKIVPKSSSYKVRVRALSASNQPLGSFSKAVIVKKVSRGPVTQFTDKGLDIPITGWLESIRKKYDVPALAGAIVTRKGIGAIGVVGYRKHGSSVKAQENDHFHLGSDTKAMTATLVGILVDKGVMHWNMTVAEVFPEWENIDVRFKKMTTEHLLAHRSGILSLNKEEDAALWNKNLNIMQRRREFTRLISHRKHAGALGINWKYENGNYIIAGAMMEKLTNKSWETLMTDLLFKPMGMTTAGFGHTVAADKVDQPWGHTEISGSRKANRGERNAMALGPAGTVHASMRDWAKFIRLHLNGHQGGVSLKGPTLTKLHTQFPPNASWKKRYGWGWGMSTSMGGTKLGHDGSNGSWFSLTFVYPHKGFAVIAAANIGGKDKDRDTDNGKGDKAVWEVINKLVARHLE